MSGTRVRPGAAAVLTVVLAAAVSAADGPGGAEVLVGLQGWLDGTRDLECRFEQTLLSGALGAGVREVGRLYLKRPGKMRWEYTRPDPKVVVLDGATAAMYFPEDRQVIRGDDAWSSSPLALLLSGEGRVEDVFEVEGVETAEPGGPWRLRLVPREADQGFVEVTVTVTSPSYALSEAEVHDEAGNRMRYEFRSLRRNRGIGDDRFVLDPPPGTEVVGSP